MRSFLRVAVAVLLVEAAAGLIVYVALQTEWAVTWPAFALLAGLIGLLAAFWLNTIVAHERGRAIARLGEKHAEAQALAAASHAKEREAIRVKAEQARAKALQEAERLRAKAARGGWGARLRWGLTMGAGLGLGFALMVTQFVALGLAVAMGVGGAGAGYALRMRQESRRLRRIEAAERAPLIEAKEAPPSKRLRLLFLSRNSDEEAAPPSEAAPDETVPPKPRNRPRR